MSEKVSDLITRLGKLSYENQVTYFDEFAKVEDWNESLVLDWFQIFHNDDDDDYAGFAWDLVRLAEKYVDPNRFAELKDTGA